MCLPCGVFAAVDFDCIKKYVDILLKLWYTLNMEQIVEIPAGVTAIKDYAFNGRRDLTTVIIPDGVTSIGKRAFCGCYNLTSVSLPSTLTEIGACAFYGCENLVSIDIPEGLDWIGTSAFYGCRKMNPVTISDKTQIGMGAFTGCQDVKVWAPYQNQAAAYKSTGPEMAR